MKKWVKLIGRSVWHRWEGKRTLIGDPITLCRIVVANPYEAEFHSRPDGPRCKNCLSILEPGAGHRGYGAKSP